MPREIPDKKYLIDNSFSANLLGMCREFKFDGGMKMNKTGIIYGINGPVIYLKGDTGFKISEMVYVGKENLVGEVIGLTKRV